ncbi:MAG: glycosyltransferase family 4 protein [Rhodospirillales bacterium]|jgi:glycosyltransferase involved in cell wall biosynthesis|nr:glycosyltransferase family 4 protein [Rhodospirillales bacterium]
MRVAMLSSESLHSIASGGLGVHVTELAAGLQRRGHEMHVITRRKENQNHYDGIDGVHYHRVDHGLNENFVECMDSMCKSMAHRFYEVTKMIGKFELIHAHDWLAANSMKYVMDGFGTPGVITMHSTEYGRDGNVFFEGFARWVRDAEAAGCHNAKVVIAVSHFLADELRRIYQVPNEKIHIVPNGVNYHAFDGYLNPAEVKGRYGIGPMAPTVFCPGRMTLQKGMDILVEAVPMVLASYPETKFIISGDGPEKDNVVRRAYECGAAHAVIFLDNLPRWQFVDLIRSVDIVAVPSRNEPFGIIVLEAWAAGKPVVATLAGGPREFIWHDVNGYLVNTDPGGMAHGIGSLLADHEHCRALGANGRRAVEDKFNWDNVAAYTEGVYHVALS